MGTESIKSQALLGQACLFTGELLYHYVVLQVPHLETQIELIF